MTSVRAIKVPNKEMPLKKTSRRAARRVHQGCFVVHRGVHRHMT